MIRAYFGLAKQPFSQEEPQLLEHQQTILDTLRVHSQQGGLCLMLGEPGTGKSTVKNALKEHDPKRMIVPTVSRTLHTYQNTIKVLCQAFAIEADGDAFKCEKRLIEESHRINKLGKALVPLIDDAHLMDMQTLRKLRLLLEDFPKNHNLVLVGQPGLLRTLQLTVNEDIKSRITYSVILPKLNPDQIEAFIQTQLDRCGLGSSAIDENALALICRHSDGVLRHARNLCLASLLDAVRAQRKTVALEHVNSVLMQPHWRKPYDEDRY
jgi:MSHA biogenesis protein MshM